MQVTGVLLLLLCCGLFLSGLLHARQARARLRPGSHDIAAIHHLRDAATAAVAAFPAFCSPLPHLVRQRMAALSPSSSLRLLRLPLS